MFYPCRPLNEWAYQTRHQLLDFLQRWYFMNPKLIAYSCRRRLQTSFSKNVERKPKPSLLPINTFIKTKKCIHDLMLQYCIDELWIWIWAREWETTSKFLPTWHNQVNWPGRCLKKQAKRHLQLFVAAAIEKFPFTKRCVRMPPFQVLIYERRVYGCSSGHVIVSCWLFSKTAFLAVRSACHKKSHGK